MNGEGTTNKEGTITMRVAILGSGSVGRILASKISSLGHDVSLGTRNVEDLMDRSDVAMGSTQTFAEWHLANSTVSVKTFSEAAADGDMLFLATSGAATLDALAAAGEENLDGKILIDITNPLDFSGGFPPTLFVSDTDSLGEQIQRAFPGAKVVKTLNTVSAPVMVDPGSLAGGEHHLFLSGNDRSAKDEVSLLLKEWFGWKHLVDLGDITTARGTEMYLALWVRLMGPLGTTFFNVSVVS